MSIEKYKGIIFKSIHYSETSLILDIYTRKSGLRSYIVSGVRKKKSKANAGLYKAMSLIDFVAYSGNSQKLYRIKEAKYAVIYQKISTDVIRSTVAMFMIDLCRNTIRERESNEELFDFIWNNFKHLDQLDKIPPDYHLSFTLKLCNYLGFYPQDNWDEEANPFFDLERGVFISDPTGVSSYLAIDEAEYLYSIMTNQSHKLQVSRAIRKSLLDNIMLYYKLHVEGFTNPPSLAVFKTIFAI